MKLKTKLYSLGLFAAISGLGFMSCQDMDRPPLGDYVQDANEVGGPLKFFTAFEGTSVDSIRATFGTPTNAKYAAGISGQAYQGDTTANIIYAAANDFSKSTSFTVAFWMKKKAHKNNAQFVFSLPTTTDIWHKSEMFMLIENIGQSSGDSLPAKFLVKDQWFEFVNEYRLPKGLDGNWHHLAFVYDENTSKLTTYWDGAARTGLPASKTDVLNAGKPRGPINFVNVSKFVIGAPSATALGSTPDAWMALYDGQLDQFRLYGTALSSAQITELFSKKQ